MYRFLLVSINIEAVLAEVTIGLRRKKLEEVERGNGLGDACTATLARLKGQKGNKAAVGLKVLKWVLHSERPLRGGELCHALAVEMGSRDLDPENVLGLQRLLSCCLGLVTFEASSSTVRLVHFTLQEHLLSIPTLFHSPHSTIAEVCLKYLNFGCVRDLPPDLNTALSTILFLEYASFYWGKHARMATTENVKILALKLLDRFNEHVSARLLWRRYYKDNGSRSYFPLVRGDTRFTALQAVSFLGIVEIVAAISERKELNGNTTDRMWNTALTWAAREGHEEVVRIFLEREGVDPDNADTYCYRTPLSWAAERGHQGVVKMLLEREEVNPERSDTNHRTPLSPAARCNNSRVTIILLKRKRWIVKTHAEHLTVEENRWGLGVSVKVSEERVR